MLFLDTRWACTQGRRQQNFQRRANRKTKSSKSTKIPVLGFTGHSGPALPLEARVPCIMCPHV